MKDGGWRNLGFSFSKMTFMRKLFFFWFPKRLKLPSSTRSRDGIVPVKWFIYTEHFFDHLRPPFCNPRNLYKYFDIWFVIIRSPKKNRGGSKWMFSFSHPCNILLSNCSTCCSNKRKDASSLSEILYNRSLLEIFSRSSATCCQWSP